MSDRFNSDVGITVNKITVHGDLIIPQTANAIVIFSHGSGSSRFSLRNREVAKYLQENNIGTLLLDLLTEKESDNYNNRFDIDLLTKRLVGATQWLEKFPASNECRIGYFGASTGAAAALKAASIYHGVRAIVSRGGRPDLAMDDLPAVTAPTLLIVGSMDTEVLGLNHAAFMKLKCERALEVVDGASHLFEELGKMGIVSELACNWFRKYLEAPVSIKHAS